MAYCEQENLLAELGQAVLVDLTDDPDDPKGEIDAAKVATAIERGAGIVDGYLGGRMAVPAPQTATLHALNTDLAIHTLFTRTGNVPEAWDKRYRDGLHLLSEIAAGRAGIGSPDDSAIYCEEAVTSSPPQDFTEEIWEMY